MTEKSRWQQEYDALPEWARALVRGLQGCVMHGTGRYEELLAGTVSSQCVENYKTVFAGLRKDRLDDWHEGFNGALDLAKALTAPWPPGPAPAREKRAFNVVELVADDEEGGGFDQPCAFGNRVGGHAVYCHNQAWPDSPRKCHRMQDDPDHRHQDCPGFVANPDITNQPPLDSKPATHDSQADE